MILKRRINRSKFHKSEHTPNILIIKRDEIGDVAYASHVPEIIANHYGTNVDIWVQSYTANLFQDHPKIDTVFTEEPDKGYDLVIDLRPKKETLSYIKKYKPKHYISRAEIRFKNRKLPVHPHEIETNYQVCQQLDENITNFPKSGCVGMQKKQRHQRDGFTSKVSGHLRAGSHFFRAQTVIQCCFPAIVLQKQP